MILETERLILRRFLPDDAAFALRLLNEPSFIENIGDRGVRTLDDAVHYLAEGPGAMYETHGHGLYLVALKQTLQPIGMCGLLKRDAFPDVDVGYAFLPEFWSKGYARESVIAALGEARALGLKKVIALVSPGNVASVRLLDKLGFSPAGRSRMTPGSADEVEVFALVF